MSDTYRFFLCVCVCVRMCVCVYAYACVCVGKGEGGRNNRAKKKRCCKPDLRKKSRHKNVCKEESRTEILELRKDYIMWPFTLLMSKESRTWLQTIAAPLMQVPFSKAVRSRSRCSSEKKLHMLRLSARVQRGNVKRRPNGGNTQCHLAPGLEARRFAKCRIETMI